MTFGETLIKVSLTHLSLSVYVQSRAKARDEMVKQGRKILQSASLGDAGEFYYFDIAEMGAVLELLFIRELPPPEKTIG